MMMMHTRSSFAALCLLAVASGTHAAQPAGPYFGALIGSTDISVRSTIELSDTDETADARWGTERLTWGAFAGWQPLQYAAVEVGFHGARKFGERFVDDDAGIAYTDSVKVSGLTGSVLGILPLGETWSLYGRVGVARIQAKFRSTAEMIGDVSGGDLTVSQSGKTRKTKPYFGLGVGVVLEGARLRFEYTKYDADHLFDGVVGGLEDGIEDVLGDDVIVSRPKSKLDMLSLSVAWYLPTGR